MHLKTKKNKKSIKVLIIDNEKYTSLLINILNQLNDEIEIITEGNPEIIREQIENDIDIVILDIDNYKKIISFSDTDFSEKSKFLILSNTGNDDSIAELEEYVQSNYILINEDSELVIKRILNNAINEKKLICEKEQYIESLKDMEQKYHMFIEKSKDIPYVINRKGNITYIGPQVENYGFRTFHFIGKPFIKFLYEEDRYTVQANFEKSVTTGVETFDTFRVDTPEKGIVWFEEKSRMITDHNNNFLMGIGILRDITERKEIEERSRQTEEKYTKIFEKANDAIFIMQNEVFTECNKRCIELYGCKSKDEIIGKTPFDFSPEFQPNKKSSKELALKYIRDAYDEKHPLFDWIHTRKDGTLINCQVSLNKFTTDKTDYLFAILREK